MQIQAERPQGQNIVTAYGPGFISVNARTYNGSLIVGYDRQPELWPVKSVNELGFAHLSGLEKNCDVILLGTGLRQAFPPREILNSLMKNRIGIEVMDTAAACRTYNVLLAEGRAVIAALIIE